jgi:hypothetical protein
LHCISITNGYGFVLERIEVYGYAVRSSDFVLTTIALSDRSGNVVGAGEEFAKISKERISLFGEVLL